MIFTTQRWHLLTLLKKLPNVLSLKIIIVPQSSQRSPLLTCLSAALEPAVRPLQSLWNSTKRRKNSIMSTVLEREAMHAGSSSSPPEPGKQGRKCVDGCVNVWSRNRIWTKSRWGVCTGVKRAAFWKQWQTLRVFPLHRVSNSHLECLPEWEHKSFYECEKLKAGEVTGSSMRSWYWVNVTVE